MKHLYNYIHTCWLLYIISSQGGSAADTAYLFLDDEKCTAIARSVNDTMVLAGGTEGNWSATNAGGGADFAAVRVTASFSGTPEVASPIRPPVEEYEPPFEGFLRDFLPPFLFVVLLGVIACCVCFCTTNKTGVRDHGGGANASRQQDQRATGLPAAAQDRPGEVVAYGEARPVARPDGGSREHERGGSGKGGDALAEEGGVVLPHSHAVEATPTSDDADGSRRAWTVVAAEVAR